MAMSRSDSAGATDAHDRHTTTESWVFQAAQTSSPPLTSADRDLLAIAEEFRTVAESARDLALGNTAVGVLPENVVAAKCALQRRMQRGLLALYGLRAEDGAPFRDARMLLTGWILFYGYHVGCLRYGEGASAHSDEAERSLLDGGARHALSQVAEFYPALRPRMREPKRETAVGDAIRGVANSPNRTPWQLIAATWDGIGRESDPERWRKDWNEHQARKDRAPDQNRPNHRDGRTA